MARGYLGKISAIVTANTGDYVRKLNESASETRNFAKTVESTLRSASRDAAKSLQGIYTPLQQFERALRAAASQRLSFKGFDGAINTVEQLKQRLSTIRDADINVVVKASGLNTITDLKLAIKDISQTDIDLFRNVGGLPGLQKLRADIEATRDAAGNLTVKPRVDIAEIDRLIERFSVIDDRTIQVVMDVLGQRELDATVAKLRQLRDVTDALQKPLATAVARFGELPQSLQGAFIPALAKAQAAVEQVTSDIEANVPVSRERFEQLAGAVALTTKSVDELRVASAALSKIRTGRELEFQQPAAVAALTRAGSVDPTPVLTQSNSKQFSEAQAAISREADELANLVAVRKRAEEEQASTGTLSVIQAQIDTKVAALNRQVEAYQQVADAAKRAAAAEAGSGDATALIARARAQQDFYAESERLQKQAAADSAAPLIARARAEQDYYAESERLQKQAAADSAAPLIARARAEQDYYAESQRLQKQAAADEAAILIARARAQQDFEAERDRLQKQAAADDVAPVIRRAQADRATAIDFGLDIDAPKRQIEVLRGSIVSLKGQLDTLPVSLRTQFVPAILEAQANLERLALQPAAAAEEIERAAEELNRLSAAASRASSLIGSFGGAGASGITSGLDSRVVQGFTSQLQVLQGVIAGVAGAARNDLAAAFDGVRQSIVSAMTDGTIATRATQESIDASIQSLARMAATASNQNVGRVLTQIARAGDIGRRGLDRFALAAQQAGFAIDDFFSVTGGLDQRIRAVSNNITQLAFIIGSTKGLFIGLSVVIGTQVVLAISKWINSGRTLEDNSKALNDTLARQKSLVEALAESFRTLGDALTQGTLSGQASDARDFAESLNRARKARKDLNDEAVLQNDPVVRRERANQARIERELQNAGDQGTVTQLQTQLEESRRRERVRRGVLVQPAPGANEVEDVLRRRAPNPFRRNVPNLPDGGELSALRERRAALEGPLERLRQIISEGPSFFDGGFRFNAASQSFDEINSLAARLDSAISNAVDGIADDLANSARGPAATIRNAQQEVADAIEAGVPGARRLGVLVDQVGNEFQDAIKALEAAVAITDPAERERAIADARSRLDSVRGRRSDIEARADAVRRERTLNPERNIDAVLSRTQSEIDRIGAPANALRSQLRELQFQRDTVRAQLEAAPADPVLIRAEQELTRALISLEGAVSDLSFDAAEASRLRGDPERGRTLSMTPAERAAEEIQQGLNDIQARFQAVAENVTGIVDTAGMEEAQARFMEDQRRQLAPAVFALQDAVQNAILQGPSRAALNAADVNTMEGSRELNRLLRGDDPARDVNLLELQKQTQLLEDSLEEQRKLAERFGGVVA